MATIAKIWCSPLTGNIYSGRVNLEKGLVVGQKKDVTDDVLQAMADRFLRKMTR